jgi:DNA polymerase-3 subunit alpha
MKQYTPYHIHSMLSSGITNIDSITDYHDYIDRAKELGMKAFAFSEHGSTFAWLKKKEYIESCGMKYIHSIEAYLTEDNEETAHIYSAVNLLYSAIDEHKSKGKVKEVKIQFSKSWVSEDGKTLAEDLETGKTVWIDPETIKDEGYKKTRDNYHIILIAKNYDGVKELNKLISRSFTRTDYHYYYYPRITIDELFETSDNIIITSACLGGVLNKGTATAKEQFLSFLINNKHRCFLEIQHHNVKEQSEYNKMLYDLHCKYDIPLIAGTDTHAINEQHMEGRAILQKAKDVHFEDEDKWDLTFKSYDELVAAYKLQNSLPIDIVLEAIENTNVMADMVEEFKVDYSPKYPKLYDNSEEVFKQKINEGIISRGINKYQNYKEYKDRIHYEYEVYKHNGAIDFMLLEENYKAEMRKRNIKYGYSRGSVSGSIIAYLLYITEIDSVKYNLNFERFMNKERVSLADVDSDWLSEDRKQVKDYLYSKNGLYCCDIITFNTIALKGAIRDVCRALYKDTDKNYLKLAEEIIAESEEDEQAARAKYIKVFKYVDMVKDVVVSVGNHPAGCVVSPFPVDEWFGTFTTSSDEYPISMLNMKEIDSLNFVKLDILGLDNIGLIYKTCDEANIPFATPDNIPVDDMNVWNSIRDDTTMIFQWETASATAYLKQLMSDETIEKIREQNPNASMMDLLSIGNGAIRPAGESYRDKLAQGIYQDNGHEALNEFLAPTLGYLVYQEQIIEFLHTFCGYTMGEADIVRRGFAKKTGTEKFIPKIKEGFQKTMLAKYSITKEESDKIIVNFIKVIEDASSYLFSKNHADPYSWIGYICGYLRYYYPIEFITTALNIFADKEEKSLSIISYAKKRGIKISPIKFRHSIAKYSYDKESSTIFKGIASIKYMNEGVANELYALRDNQYNSFIELLDDIKKNTSTNSRQLGILIDLDFFTEFGDANYLSKLALLYDEFADKKQLKKDKLDSFDLINEPALQAIVRKYAGKETDKTFLEVDSFGVLNVLAKRLKVPKRTLQEKVGAQITHLGYIDTYDKRYAKMLVIISIDTKYSPKLKVYSLKNGTTLEAKIDRKTFNTHKIAKGDIIKVDKQRIKPKVKRLDDGNYVPIPDTSEIWLTEYHKVENL